MARTGRPRQDLRQSPLEHLEAFCCAQVVRIEHMLSMRYGFDSDIREGHNVSDNRYHAMPQNDDMCAMTFMNDAVVEVRK